MAKQNGDGIRGDPDRKGGDGSTGNPGGGKMLDSAGKDDGRPSHLVRLSLQFEGFEIFLEAEFGFVVSMGFSDICEASLY